MKMLKISLLLVLLTAGFAHAQDAVDIAQDIDIAEVDAKANEARGKANSLELRVTELEADVAILEAQPPVDPTIEGRLTVLENAPPASPVKYVVRDSLGTYVDSWTDRNSVGPGAMTLPDGKRLACVVDKETITFTPKKPEGIVYELPDCSATLNKVFVIITDDRRPSYQYQPQRLSFDNDVEGQLIENSLYVPDWQNPFYVSGGLPLHQRVDKGLGDGSFDCRPIIWDGGNLASMVWVTDLPTFTPPFSLTEE